MRARSDLREFYESIKRGAVQQFVEEHRQESVHLDFTTLENEERFPKPDRRAFAKAISGFANSEGGVLVWGIVARKDDDGVDAATELRPLASARRLVSRFESYTGEATSPIVEGVLHGAILEDGGAGYVKTLVPESAAGPQMAKMGENRYFKRSGDSFYLMEHFDIADMFGRRPKPVLSFYARIVGGMLGTQAVVVGIENSGKGIARYPSLIVSCNPESGFTSSMYGLDGNYNTGLPRIVAHGSRTGKFGGGADSVVHAGTVLEVTRLATPRPARPRLEITYAIAAEGVPCMEGTHVVEPDDWPGGG